MFISERVQAAWTPRLLSVIRILVALYFIEHPTAKFFTFPHVAGFDKLQQWSLIWTAGILEISGGALLLLGLFTRPVAFILSGEMAVAYFMFRPPRGFFPILNGGEIESLFCFVFFLFFLFGGGAWSLDRLRARGGNHPG